MITKIVRLSTWLVSGCLLLFTLRRWLFLLAVLWPDCRGSSEAEKSVTWPAVLLLVPVRNERAGLAELVQALRGLDYPAERLELIFIDDGSTDGSGEILQAAVADRQNWCLLRLEHNLGKAAALNAALDSTRPGEVVVIYDADECPQSDALRRLVSRFCGPAIGGVSGRRAVLNPLAGPAATYTTFEGLVHQLITMQAKDRLKLAPAILGSNCAYRRSALVQAGGFKTGALLEDTDLTLSLARAGWQTRFEPQAVSYHTVPTTLAGYWRQHTRWARGFNDAARDQAIAILLDHRLAWPLRLELLLFALGYLDRLAVAAGSLLLLFGRAKRPLTWLLPFALLTPLAQTIAALKLEQAPAALWTRLIWLPFFLLLDVAMAVAGLWNALRQAPRHWEERQARS